MTRKNRRITNDRYSYRHYNRRADLVLAGVLTVIAVTCVTIGWWWPMIEGVTQIIEGAIQ